MSQLYYYVTRLRAPLKPKCGITSLEFMNIYFKCNFIFSFDLLNDLIKYASNELTVVFKGLIQLMCQEVIQNLYVISFFYVQSL